MTNDKELVEGWRKQFEEFCEKERISTKISPDGEMYAFSSTACLWGGWLAAKRSQPSVVLPRPAIKTNHFDDPVKYWHKATVEKSITAAGIKYTIGE